MFCNVGFTTELATLSEEDLNAACEMSKMTKLECDDFKRKMKNTPSLDDLKKRVLEQPKISEWNWIKVAEGTETFPLPSYIDKNSVKKEGKYKYFWSLSNYNERSSDGIISTAKYYKVDCKKIQKQLLRFKGYSEHWAKGELISDWETNEEERVWGTGHPKSSVKKVLKTVCKETYERKEK